MPESLTARISVCAKGSYVDFIKEYKNADIPEGCYIDKMEMF